MRGFLVASFQSRFFNLLRCWIRFFTNLNLGWLYRKFDPYGHRANLIAAANFIFLASDLLLEATNTLRQI